MLDFFSENIEKPMSPFYNMVTKIRSVIKYENYPFF